MLLALITSYLTFTSFTCASPFHKYPFVFLLDVGNEELEKTNTEQIRVAIPGGSLAIRHPAVGNGETVSHVRVSSIDFGTDLKANIIDGGPGYKYVVLAFVGNKGMPYDVVVTIQTIPSEADVDYYQEPPESVPNMYANGINSYGTDVVEPNDSPEEIHDSIDSEHSNDSESVQASSNIYAYAQDEANEVDYDENEKDIHKQYLENDNQSVEEEDYLEDPDDQSELDGELSDVSIEEEDTGEYSSDEDNIDGEDSEEPQNGDTIVDDNSYSKYQYQTVKSRYYDVQAYPQEAVDEQNQAVNVDPFELEPTYNDEEIHNDAVKYKDANNNYFDSDDRSAVAY